MKYFVCLGLFQSCSKIPKSKIKTLHLGGIKTFHHFKIPVFPLSPSMRANHQMRHEFPSGYSQPKMHFSKLTVSLQKKKKSSSDSVAIWPRISFLSSPSSNFSTLHSYLHSLKTETDSAKFLHIKFISKLARVSYSFCQNRMKYYQKNLS